MRADNAFAKRDSTVSMGIRGLGAYLDQNGGFDRFDDISQASNAAKTSPSLVIDGLSLCHYLRNQTKLFPFTGFIWFFTEAAKAFFNRLFEAGVESIVVVFDGCHESIKHATHKQRRSRRWDAMAALMTEIKQDLSGSISASRDLTSISMYRMAMIDILQWQYQNRARVVVGSGEADRLAAQICRSENHFAILAEDSDYLLMNARYMPLSSLYLGEEYDTPAVHGKVFTPERVTKVLGMSPKLYGAFACICGNDYIHGETLEKIHNKLKLSSKLSPSALIKTVSGMIKSGEIKEAQLLKLLEGSGSRSETNLLQKYRLSCSMYDTDGLPQIQPEEWMRKTRASESLADKFVVGSAHPAIFGIFQSKTNWIALHPYDTSDSKIYDVGMSIRLRVLGMISAAFGFFSPGTIFQEEGAMEKTRKVSPVYELGAEEFGIAWSAKDAISGLLEGPEAMKTRQNVFSTLCGALGAKLDVEFRDSDPTVQLTLASLASVLQKDAKILSEDELDQILFHSFLLLNDEALSFIKELVPGLTSRKHGSAREIHLTSLMLLTLETAMIVNQLCGTPLSIKMDRVFDGAIFQNLSIHMDELCEKYPNDWRAAKRVTQTLVGWFSAS